MKFLLSKIQRLKKSDLFLYKKIYPKSNTTMNYYSEVLNSLSIIGEMLTDRGENASDILHFSKSEIHAIIDKNSGKMFSIVVDHNMIVYDMSTKFKLADVKKYVEDNITDDVNLVIIIEKDNENVKKCVNICDTDFQVFSLQELQFNKSKHELVPKHELIKNESDIKTILTNYQLKSKSLLPCILTSDPMAKYFNAKNGNVMKITRVSPTAGETIVYRVVV
jgi:DNA-directed RNA polymerase subunit H (RpoH/RPB5)